MLALVELLVLSILVLVLGSSLALLRVLGSFLALLALLVLGILVLVLGCSLALLRALGLFLALSLLPISDPTRPY